MCKDVLLVCVCVVKISLEECESVLVGGEREPLPELRVYRQNKRVSQFVARIVTVPPAPRMSLSVPRNPTLFRQQL